MEQLQAFLARAEALLARLEPLLPPARPEPDWSAPAYRWRRQGMAGWLEGVNEPHTLPLARLTHIDNQLKLLVRNTRQFVKGKPANNVLLTGARGTGKSSLVKALLPEFADKGLRIIEVDKEHLSDLAEIMALVAGRKERYILFCDDLSFEDGDDAYKALKTALDGGLARRAENMLVYATSNRRHLMLRDQVVEAVANGQFHIWHGEEVDDVLELLTGAPAAGMHGSVAKRLAEYTETLKALAANEEKKEEKPSGG